MNTMSDHTMKAFDTDLQELTRKVAEMGGLAEREIADSIQALTRRDANLAMRVVAADPESDSQPERWIRAARPPAVGHEVEDAKRPIAPHAPPWRRRDS